MTLPTSPPNSFWVLLTSNTMVATTIHSATGAELRLKCGVWHCLPRSLWADAVARMVEGQRRQGDYAHFAVEVFDPTPAQVAA